MYAQRINHQIIENSIENQFITAILGPRRVGKTFFVQHYAERYPERAWVFLNMDRMDQRKRIADSQLTALISEAAKKQIGIEKIWVIIDEAQKSPEIFDQIKIIYDQFKGQNKIKFIITGSAILSLHRFSAESLAGRIDLHYLQEFTLREATFLREKSLPMNSLFDELSAPEDPVELDDIIQKIAPFRPSLEQQMRHLLLWGGFPELLSDQTSQERISYLNNYLQTYLEKDVRAVETITDLNLYRNMLDILAEQTGSLRDDKRIMSALGCTRDTLKKYRGYLEATLLYTEIFPYISSSLKRLVKSPKGYLLNNGLISILTGIIDLNVLQKSGLIGHRFENWFLNEIKTWVERSPLPQRIQYWRTSSGVEVDFVVVKKPDVFPFEITFSEEPHIKKIRNLQIFLKEEPLAKWGYYIYRGDFAVDRKARIIFIPYWAVG